MKKYEKKLNELRNKKLDLEKKASVVSVDEKEIRERKKAEKLLKEDPEMIKLKKIENVVEYQNILEKKAKELEKDIKKDEKKLEKNDQKIVDYKDKINECSEQLEKLNNIFADKEKESEELLQKYDELVKKDKELQKELREEEDPDKQEEIKNEIQSNREKMEYVAEKNKIISEGIQKEKDNKDIQKEKDKKQKRINNYKEKISKLEKETESLEVNVLNSIDEYNDYKNKSAKCDLVIGNLVNGKSWDEIEVKAEGFKNRNFKSKEDITTRANRFGKQEEVEEALEHRIKQYKEKFKKEPSEEAVKNLRKSIISGLNSKLEERDHLKRVEKALKDYADREAGKTGKTVKYAPGTEPNPSKKPESEEKPKLKWWQFIKRFKAWRESKKVKNLPEETTTITKTTAPLPEVKRDEFLSRLHDIADNGLDRTNEDLKWDKKISAEIDRQEKEGKNRLEARKIALEKYGIDARIEEKIGQKMKEDLDAKKIDAKSVKSKEDYEMYREKYKKMAEKELGITDRIQNLLNKGNVVKFDGKVDMRYYNKLVRDQYNRESLDRITNQKLNKVEKDNEK